MNTVIKILILNLIILLLACKREPKYINIPENIRQALLYYKFEAEDTFKLLKNNSDTIYFVVRSKKIYYQKIYLHKDNYEEYYLEIESTNSNYYIEIHTEIISTSTDINKNKYRYGIFIKQAYVNSSISTNNIYRFYNIYTLNNKVYNNVYYLNYIDNNININDSILTSPDKGIIKAWNDYITFSIIE